MPHDRSEWRKEPELTPEQRQQIAETRARKEHEKAVGRDITNLVQGMKGQREPYPGEYEKSALRLAALQQSGDPVLEQMLTELGGTADKVRALLNNQGVEEKDDKSVQHTVEYREDGTIVLTNPTTRVIIVSLELRPHSARETIRLAPGQTMEIKPTITSRAQTWEEWSEEGEPQRSQEFNRWLGNLRIVGGG